MNRQPTIIIRFMNQLRSMLRILNNMLQQFDIARVGCIMCTIATGTLLLIGLVRPPGFPILIGIFSPPLEGLETAVDDVGW